MQDKQMMFLDEDAYDTTPEVLDLGITFHPGAGNMLKGRISSSQGDVAGMTAMVIKTGSTAATATTTIATLPITAAMVNAGHNFSMPLDELQQFATIALTGATAGTGITAGLQWDVQTA